MVERGFVKVAVDAELAELAPPHTDSVSAQGLANCTGSGKVGVAEVETWWEAGECS